VATDARSRYLAVPRISENGIVMVLEITGSGTEAAQFEMLFGGHSIVVDGRLTRVEWFPLEKLEDVLRRFDELQDTPRPGPPPNVAAQVARHVADLQLAFDWDAVAAAHTPDLLVDDRRPGIRMRVEGNDRLLELAKAQEAVSEIELTLLATRGESLCLHRSRFAGSSDPAGPFEVEVLEVNEVTEDGRIRADIIFDPDDLDGAFEELDRRFAEGEGAQCHDVLAATSAFIAGIRDRDATAVASLYQRDARIADHRPVGWGDVGPEDYGRLLQSFFDLSHDFDARITAVLRLSPRGAVVTMQGTGTDALGGRFDIDTCQLFLTSNGKITRHEHYAIDAVVDVETRFDALTVWTSWETLMDNRAAAVGGEIESRLLAGDAVGFAALFADDAVADDRRAGLRNTGAGTDFLTQLGRGLQGITQVMPCVLATRGERLVLLQVIFSGTDQMGGGFEVEVLELIEIDDKGLVSAIVMWDGADRDAAEEELEQRYERAEGATHADVWHAANALLAGYATRDWQAVEDSLAPTLRTVDHQPMAWPWHSRSRDTYVTVMREMAGQVRDDRLRRAAVLRTSSQGGVSLLVHTGTDLQGSAFERRLVTVTLVYAGQITRLEYWAEHDVEAAMTRFDELTSAG
jgi:hypothetical protein